MTETKKKTYRKTEHKNNNNNVQGERRETEFQHFTMEGEQKQDKNSTSQWRVNKNKTKTDTRGNATRSFPLTMSASTLRNRELTSPIPANSPNLNIPPGAASSSIAIPHPDADEPSPWRQAPFSQTPQQRRPGKKEKYHTKKHTASRAANDKVINKFLPVQTRASRQVSPGETVCTCNSDSKMFRPFATLQEGR